MALTILVRLALGADTSASCDPAPAFAGQSARAMRLPGRRADVHHGHRPYAGVAFGLGASGYLSL